MVITVLPVYPLVTALLSDLEVPKRERFEILERLRHEGLPFLTKRLPLLVKHVLFCLESGTWIHPGCPALADPVFGFRLRGCQLGRVPLIGFSFITQIFLPGTAFDQSFGLLRLRTLCEYLYKLALPFAKEDRLSALNKLILSEQRLASLSFDSDSIAALRHSIATNFPLLYELDFGGLMESIRANVADRSSRPYVADTSGSFNKGPLGFDDGPTYRSSKDAYDGYYPPDRRQFSGSYRYRLCDARYGSKMVLEEAPHGLYARTSKGLLVPKDSRGPRVVMPEPIDSLAFQMGLHYWLAGYLQEASDGRVQFTDQSHFRAIAQEASKTRGFCTIDLKDASNSVSARLVRALLSNTGLGRHVREFRTGIVEFHVSGLAKEAFDETCLCPLNGSVDWDASKVSWEIQMLAGMGSGYTFPVMAMLIYSICTMVIPAPYHSNIRVFGDDLIVPTWARDRVTEALSRYGLLVNTNKSFSHGFFRESCGGDYFRGEEVAPPRLKLTFCDLDVVGEGSNVGLTGRRDELLLKVERHCREIGFMPKLQAFYYSWLENQLMIRLQRVSRDCAVLGRYDGYTHCKDDLTYGYKPCSVSFSGDAFLDDWVNRAIAGLREDEDGSSPLKHLFPHPPKVHSSTDARYASKLVLVPVYGVERRPRVDL